MLTDQAHQAPVQHRGPWLLILGMGRWVTSFPGLLAALLVAELYWTCRDRIVDPDIWWHLKNAQYLLTTGHFPNFDSYSFTAAGSPWINHEWLGGLCFYAAYHAFGLRGIFLLFIFLLAAMAVTVFRLAQTSGGPYAAAITTLAGGLLSIVGFSPRTQLFGWLCFLGIYAILLRVRSGRPAPLWLVPILFCVWINFHGSWLLGLLIYGLVVGCGLIRRNIGCLAAAPWSPTEVRRLAIAGVASVAALMVNPFGYRLLIFPYYMAFRQPLGVARVEEWASVDFNDPRGKVVAIVLAGIAYLVVAGRKRWRIDEAALTAFVLYCGLFHIRFLLLAGILLPPLLAPQFGRFGSYDPQRERRILNAAFLVGVAGLFVFGFPSDRMLRDQIAAFFPVDAIEFLKAHPQPGRIFNAYEAGGYLEWNLPQVPVFVDSRNDIFEYNGVLRDYLAITDLRNSQELLDRYGVTYILFPKSTPLAYFLTSNRRWERLYEGSDSIILRRAPRLD